MRFGAPLGVAPQQRSQTTPTPVSVFDWLSVSVAPPFARINRQLTDLLGNVTPAMQGSSAARPQLPVINVAVERVDDAARRAVHMPDEQLRRAFCADLPLRIARLDSDEDKVEALNGYLHHASQISTAKHCREFVVDIRCRVFEEACRLLAFLDQPLPGAMAPVLVEFLKPARWDMPSNEYSKHLEMLAMRLGSTPSVAAQKALLDAMDPVDHASQLKLLKLLPAMVAGPLTSGHKEVNPADRDVHRNLLNRLTKIVAEAPQLSNEEAGAPGSAWHEERTVMFLALAHGAFHLSLEDLRLAMTDLVTLAVACEGTSGETGQVEYLKTLVSHRLPAKERHFWQNWIEGLALEKRYATAPPVPH